LSKTKSSELAASGSASSNSREKVQDRPGKRPVTGVVFGEFGAEHQVLGQGQEPVGHIFPERHTPAAGVAAEDARAEHAVVETVADHGNHGRNQLGRVLVVRMYHDDDVGTQFERRLVTGLLVAAIADVALVAHQFQAQIRGQGDRVVLAEIVHQNDFVHVILATHFLVGTAQGFLRVVGGHDHDRAMAAGHGRAILSDGPAGHKPRPGPPCGAIESRGGRE